MLVSEGMMMDWNLDYRNIVFLYYSEEIDIINENMWTEGMNAENGHVAPWAYVFLGAKNERRQFSNKNLDLNIFVYSSGENRFKNATLKR